MKTLNQLSIYDFGAQILETGDLDPVYIVLHRARLDKVVLYRYLLAYWAFYHMGTASWISDVREKDEGAFWDRMETAAGSKEYPRSAERRHYRGRNAAQSVEWLRGCGISGLFDPFKVEFSNTTAAEVITYVQTWRGFGPWISFKVADMLERLGICRVSFDLWTVMYDSPRKGVRDLWAQEIGTEPLPTNVDRWAVRKILDNLGDRLAPPDHKRRINLQEVETILCKWHSYLGGHYHVGEDVGAVKKGLERFGSCPLAKRLWSAGKGGGLWG